MAIALNVTERYTLFSYPMNKNSDNWATIALGKIATLLPFESLKGVCMEIPGSPSTPPCRQHNELCEAVLSLPKKIVTQGEASNDDGLIDEQRLDGL